MIVIAITDAIHAERAKLSVLFKWITHVLALLAVLATYLEKTLQCECSRFYKASHKSGGLGKGMIATLQV